MLDKILLLIADYLVEFKNRVRGAGNDYIAYGAITSVTPNRDGILQVYASANNTNAGVVSVKTARAGIVGNAIGAGGFLIIYNIPVKKDTTYTIETDNYTLQGVYLFY